MRAARLFLLFPLLAACQQIEDIKDKASGLVNPLVVEGLYLGVAEPESDEIDLSSTDFANGAVIQVFLADAASVTDIEDAPVEGATVRLRSDANGPQILNDEGSGRYAADAGDGLDYRASDGISLVVDLTDGEASLDLTAPPAADVDIDETHSANSAMVVDLEGQGFDSALVVVFEASSGDVTFSNRPESVKEIYDFSHGGDGESLIIELPATAFPDQTIYAVGVAGLVSATADEMVDVNTGLSTFMAGKMKFYPVSTL